MKAREKLEQLVTVGVNNIRQFVMTAFNDEKLATELEHKMLMAHLAKNPPRR